MLSTGLAAELPDRVRRLISEIDIADDTEAVDDQPDELHASLSGELASADLRRPVLLEMGLVARLLERIIEPTSTRGQRT